MWIPVYWLWPSPASSVGHCRTGLPLESPGWEQTPMQFQVGSQCHPPFTPLLPSLSWVQLIIVSALIKPQEREKKLTYLPSQEAAQRKTLGPTQLLKYTARETNCSPCFSAKGYSTWAYECHCDSHSCGLLSMLPTLCSNRYASSVSIIFIDFSLRLIWHSA